MLRLFLFSLSLLIFFVNISNAGLDKVRRISGTPHNSDIASIPSDSLWITNERTGKTITDLEIWVGWHEPLKISHFTPAITYIYFPDSANTIWSDEGVVSLSTEGILTGVSGGLCTLTFNHADLSCELRVKVNEAPREPVYEDIPEFLANPAADAVKIIPVVILRFFPTLDGENLDLRFASDFFDLGDPSIENMIKRIDRYDKNVKFMAEEATRFRGYKNENSRPYLGYKVIEYITIFEPTPGAGVATYDDKHHLPIYRPDWHLVFERLNMKHYIDDLGVKEIWIWDHWYGAEQPSFDPDFHDPIHFRGPSESNMSNSPVTGDISNSHQSPTDLPVYDNTYIVYNQNYRRDESEAFHNRCHQFEWMLNYVDIQRNGIKDLFWNKFVGYGTTGRCGWTHFPPNTMEPSKYNSMAFVNSDIEDWRPDNAGEKKPVNAMTWCNLEYDWPTIPVDHCECNFYLYWTQSFPGFQNHIPYLTPGYEMSNWWEFVFAWDSANIAGMNLYKPVEAEIMVDSQHICHYDTLYFRNQEDFYCSEYLWEFPGGIPSTSTAVRPSVFYNEIGEFDVSLRIVHPDGDTVYDYKEDFISVGIIPGLEAYIVDSSRLCEGDMATLTVNKGDLISWFKYSFDPFHRVTESGTYSALVFDNYGCNSIDTIDVQFYPLPKIDLSGDTLICAGDSTLLIAEGGDHYIWSTGLSDTSIWVDSTGIYEVAGTDSRGCTAIDEMEVVVRPLPEPELSGTLETCVGDSSLLRASGGHNYIWSTGESTDSLFLSRAGEYYLVAIDEFHCSDTLFFSFAENPRPIASIAGDEGFCEGDSLYLTASGGSSYYWPIQEKNGTGIWVGEGSMVNVIVRNEHNCSDTAWHEVIVYELPEAAFSEEIVFDTVYFLNESSGADSCLWIFGDGMYDGSMNPMHKYGSTGTFTVELQAMTEMGCRDTAIHNVTIESTWLEENELLGAFMIYPNPAIGSLQIEWNPLQEMAVGTYLRITGISGQEMKTLRLEPGLTVVDIKDLDPGTYILMVRMKNRWVPADKFIKY